jgi:hypothetical protein
MSFDDTEPSLRAPIGAIVRALEAALPTKIKGYPSPAHLRQIAHVYGHYDSRFSIRPDYNLWRTAIFPYFAINDEPWLRGPPFQRGSVSWPLFTALCVESSDPVVLWSTIALAPNLIESQQNRAELGPEAPIWEFANRLYERLDSELPLLPGCPRSCAMAAVLFLVRHQHLHYKSGRSLGLAACKILFRHIKVWLQIVDPSWVPGRRLNTDAMEKERLGPHRLRASHSAYEFSIFVNALSTLRPILSENINIFDLNARGLLHEAYEYALTAWHTARSRRIYEIEFQRSRGWYATLRSRKLRRTAYLKELDCHLAVTNAARDAGEYLEAAKLLYLLYRLFPDELANDPIAKRELGHRTITFRYIGEVGLEVDPRFRIDQIIRDHYGQTRTDTLRARREGDSPPHRMVASQAYPPDTDEESKGFLLRIIADRRTDPNWSVIMNAIPPDREDTPVGHLLSVMRLLADAVAPPYPAVPHTLVAAFNLALRYGYIRSAGKILSRLIYTSDFQLNETLLLDFVHHVKRCTQLDPFGMSQDRFVEWQELIRASCRKLIDVYESEWLKPKDRIWLHETLLGRSHVQHRSLSRQNAQILYEKSADSYRIQASDLREFYDLNYNFMRRVPPPAGAPTLKAFCSSFSKHALGAPVLVSILLLGNNVSIVAIAKNGEPIAGDVVVNTLLEDVSYLEMDSGYWFRSEMPAAKQISWPLSFRRIAMKILEMAALADADARVLVISMDWSLARFPWQHLVSIMSDKNYVIALVPNLTMLSLPKRSTMSEITEPTLVLSANGNDDLNDPVLEINHSILRTTAEIDLIELAIRIVTGHGSKPAAGELPAVTLGPEGDGELRELEEWIRIVMTRVVVLHCCHSAHTRPVFMEEIGGVAGLALSLGAEALIAPTAEVHSSAAITLQEFLFASGGDALGARYLNAITKDPECSVYNFWGNPYETFFPLEG